MDIDSTWLVVGFVGLFLSIIHFVSLARIANGTTKMAATMEAEREQRAQIARDLANLKFQLTSKAP